MTILIAAPAEAKSDALRTMSDAEFRAWLLEQVGEVDAEAGDYRPEVEAFAPSIEDEAALLGFTLVMEGEDPAGPRGGSFTTLVAFYDGVCAAWGVQAREWAKDRTQIEAWLETLARPEPDWDAMYPDDRHEAEIVEAGSRSGHPASEG